MDSQIKSSFQADAKKGPTISLHNAISILKTPSSRRDRKENEQLTMLLMSSDFFANIAPDIVAIAAGHLFYSHVNLGHVIQRKNQPCEFFHFIVQGSVGVYEGDSVPISGQKPVQVLSAGQVIGSLQTALSHFLQKKQLTKPYIAKLRKGRELKNIASNNTQQEEGNGTDSTLFANALISLKIKGQEDASIKGTTAENRVLNLWRGDLLGEESVLIARNARRTYSARSIATYSEVLLMRKEDFVALVQQNRSSELFVKQQVLHKLAAINKREWSEEFEEYFKKQNIPNHTSQQNSQQSELVVKSILHPQAPGSPTQQKGKIQAHDEQKTLLKIITSGKVVTQGKVKRLVIHSPQAHALQMQVSRSGSQSGRENTWKGQSPKTQDSLPFGDNTRYANICLPQCTGETENNNQIITSKSGHIQLVLDSCSTPRLLTPRYASQSTQRVKQLSFFGTHASASPSPQQKIEHQELQALMAKRQLATRQRTSQFNNNTNDEGNAQATVIELIQYPVHTRELASLSSLAQALQADDFQIYRSPYSPLRKLATRSIYEKKLSQRQLRGILPSKTKTNTMLPQSATSPVQTTTTQPQKLPFQVVQIRPELQITSAANNNFTSCKTIETNQLINNFAQHTQAIFSNSRNSDHEGDAVAEGTNTSNYIFHKQLRREGVTNSQKLIKKQKALYCKNIRQLQEKLSNVAKQKASESGINEQTCFQDTQLQKLKFKEKLSEFHRRIEKLAEERAAELMLIQENQKETDGFNAIQDLKQMCYKNAKQREEDEVQNKTNAIILKQFLVD